MAEISADRQTNQLPSLRRRKVRKGTQSCWECKRRKIRCTFVTSTKSVCDGCRSRQLKCISQEFYNDGFGPINDKTVTTDRIQHQRVDDVVDIDPVPNDTQETWTETNRNIGNDVQVALASPNTSNFAAKLTQNSNVELKGYYGELRRALLAAWPSQPELDLMTKVTVGISVLFHGIVCTSYSKFLNQTPLSPAATLQRPPSWSHPVFIARKLLMLGSFLQGITPTAAENLGSVSKTYRKTMAHMINTASRLVTTNDDLVDSLEGIECLMIECMYQNNEGNLRRAWLINRRALVIAQMLGLHLNQSSSTPKALDDETRARIDPEYMWIRLVMSDQYLSLMLGLPQATSDTSFTHPRFLASCEPLERMDRLHVVVGSLLLQRKREDLHDLEATYEIDKLLKDAAAVMPPQWWLTPDTTAAAGFDAKAFREIIRINKQFAHYHMLVQLHLPYLLRSSPDGRFDSSKITAANASREVLSRFVNFRGGNIITAYCRGIDFLAFVASTTLCLAHIDAYRQERIGFNSATTLFHFLGHQRLVDRGLIERTLQIMDDVIQVRQDAVACKVASILRPLLCIEASVAKGNSYTAVVASEHDEQDLASCDGEQDGNKALCINISHLGTIKIERDGSMRYAARRTCEESTRPNWIPNTTVSKKDSFSQSISSRNQADSYSIEQPSLSAACFTGRHMVDHSMQRECQSVPPDPILGYEFENIQARANNKEISTLQNDALHTEHLPGSGSASDMDDFALQGVDMAIFDNLFEGLGAEL